MPKIDGAGSLRAEVGEHPFLAGVAHDRDAFAAPQAERAQAVRAARDPRRVSAPGRSSYRPRCFAR